MARDGVEFLAERMNEAGYVTGAFGKLHHTPPDDPRGFQEAALMEEGRLGEAEPYFEWLRECRPGDDDPFLAWVSFQGPHEPLDPPSAVKGTVDTEGLPAPLERPDDDLAGVVEYRKARGPAVDSREEVMARRTAYAEIVVEIDRQVGRILDRLEELDVFEETTVVFAADHGDLLGDFGLWAKGPFPYRGQLDVPMIVANHPAIQGGTRSDRPAGTIDIPGTCLDVAYPLSAGDREKLLEAGLSAEYNEFCRGRDPVANYADPYWVDEE